MTIPGLNKKHKRKDILIYRTSKLHDFGSCNTYSSLGPVVNIIFCYFFFHIMLILINSLKINKIIRLCIKGIGCPLLISVGIVIFDQETEKKENIIRLEPRLY